jgi:hypothetical protein
MVVEVESPVRRLVETASDWDHGFEANGKRKKATTVHRICYAPKYT